MLEVGFTVANPSDDELLNKGILDDIGQYCGLGAPCYMPEESMARFSS